MRLSMSRQPSPYTCGPGLSPAASLSLISAVANKGELRWMIVDGAVNAPTLILFLARLIREARRKVFLILDRLRVHRARLTRDWLTEHRAKIEV
jgi:hypothetical protein